mmetsp:Transcript_5928/g.21627  ORF Transcript_5928/g.21627 Transcript_5928/m.21627 type:complete len:247 (-) Transcript_5928:157-897(-)
MHAHVVQQVRELLAAAPHERGLLPPRPVRVRRGGFEPRRADGAHETLRERPGRRRVRGVRLQRASDVAEARFDLVLTHPGERAPRRRVGPGGDLRDGRLVGARARAALFAVAARAELQDEVRERVADGAAEDDGVVVRDGEVSLVLALLRGDRRVVVEGRARRRRRRGELRRRRRFGRLVGRDLRARGGDVDVFLVVVPFLVDAVVDAEVVVFVVVVEDADAARGRGEVARELRRGEDATRRDGGE